ncbi:protein of unknown function DUF1576 [Alkaliphilus metalliredigens QYMF]|uniref:DUF1576 domain-containing protein n=1 Tax=Alkaliphilus metalliredigens (strain QYMF) TaxID=293826 RepID=A6TW26_ALKMQ|nr:DUF1576 domain-containing protein [Alkaliphilus metalliredigens]ABR50394.1 protein of unknown function DUF1576 [Alkaliphilus metalliredigens QYMF]
MQDLLTYRWLSNLKGRKKTMDQVMNIGEKPKYIVMTIYAVMVLISSLFFNTPGEIMGGLGRIVIHPSTLVSDYMVIGNIGATFFNSGLLMLIAIAIAKLNKAIMNGPMVAAIFTVGGFALFGKNFYNIWPILLGVLIYAKVQKEKFSKFIIIAFFGTALGPLISQISFGYGATIVQGMVMGIAAGMLVGFVLPPLANHLLKFHQGFNLYNIGFTAGMIGTFFMAVMRAYGISHETTLIVAEGYNFVFAVYLSILFISMLMVGFFFNGNSFAGYGKLIKHSGRAVSDFVALEGFGMSFINMGILGLVSTAYVIIVGGELNGATIGGVFTIVGFGAFGKHVKNVTPILIGVILASLTQVWALNSTGALLAALFGTTLAPIAGQFGWTSGIVAGFLHMAMVMNVGYLHGGMNLYNNGFSGGMVAGILVPIIESFRKEE